MSAARDFDEVELQQLVAHIEKKIKSLENQISLGEKSGGQFDELRADETNLRTELLIVKRRLAQLHPRVRELTTVDNDAEGRLVSINVSGKA